MHIGLDGHVMPLIRVGGALVGRGHDVTVWIPERYRARVEATGARMRAYDPFEQRPVLGAYDFPAAVFEGTADTVEGLADELRAADVDLVVHDTQALWGRVAGLFLGLPRIVTFPLFLSFSLDAPPFLPVPDDVAEHAQVLVGELEHRWGVELGGWRTALVTDGDATVCTTTSRVMGHDDLPPGWHYVGPLMEPIARVEHGARPLVYVALGTMFSFNPDPFARVIDALAEEPVDVFVALGNAPVRDQLGSLPQNVSVHGYVDSRAVLARASVHVTHGGASSVHESIVGGVPMVCLPQGSDHNGWAAQIEALGIGEVVGDDSTAIRNAVRRLLEDDGPRERVVELSEHLLRFDGPERLDRVVAELIVS